MGLFGGGSKTSTSKTTRPGYIKDFVNSLNNQIQNASSGSYVNQGYAGLTDAQQDALAKMVNSPEVSNLANQLTSGGQQGLDNLNNVYNQIQNLYSQGEVTPDKLNALASQLYDQGSVESAIGANNRQIENQLASATNPAIAQQTLQQAGFGSSNRLARDQATRGALTDMQQGASDITNQAYNNAINQANAIMSGNRSNQQNALSGLLQNSSAQAGYGLQGSQLANNQALQSLQAGQLQQQNEQNRLNNLYQNGIMNQNWGYQDINNKLGAASVLNGALGQTQKTTTSGGGGGMLGGAMSGAAAGSAFGPWGALAGAAIGAAASA